jgi:NADPH:quinone reductase-like Zn-dependent oxidoreductase
VFGWCDGAFAEYACAAEDHFAAKPAALSFEQAGVVPISGFAALQAVRDVGEVQAGQRSWSSGRLARWAGSRSR